jgi:hypothetical protein
MHFPSEPLVALVSTIVAAITLALPCASFAAVATTLVTPRGAPIQVIADRPPGKGPFPTVVLGSGATYHQRLPILAETAKALVRNGVAVYRFDWAARKRYSARGSHQGSRSPRIH